MTRLLISLAASIACTAAVLAAHAPAPAPKTPAQLGITLGYPVLVAEQTGHLWFPKIEVLPGGGLQIVCSGQSDSGKTSGAFQTTSMDHGKTWAALAPWRYGGITNWKESQVLVGLPWDYTSADADRTALVGELVAVDGSGKNVDLDRKAVRITGFPRGLAQPSHGHTSSFTTDCDGVVITGERMVTLGYGRFVGDLEKHRTGGRSRDSYFGYSLVALESLDGGRNWRYLTTVCDWTHWENDPAWVDRGRFEGPCESSLVSLANGGLILATGRPGIWLWYSADGSGETWAPIEIGRSPATGGHKGR